jgi:hypothetical protein
MSRNPEFQITALSRSEEACGEMNLVIKDESFRYSALIGAGLGRLLQTGRLLWVGGRMVVITRKLVHPKQRGLTKGIIFRSVLSSQTLT